MIHQFTITISTPDVSMATLVRDEAVNAIQDMVDRMRPAFSIDCGVLQDVGGPLDALYIAAARDEHESEGSVEIDENAVVSYGEDNGAYVEAWIWVGENATLQAAREALEAQDEKVESEGGLCD